MKPLDKAGTEQEFRTEGGLFVGLVVAAITWGTVAYGLSASNAEELWLIAVDVIFFLIGVVALAVPLKAKFVVGKLLSYSPAWPARSWSVAGDDLKEFRREETEGGARIICICKNGQELIGPDTYLYGKKVEQAIRQWAETNKIPEVVESNSVTKP